MRPDLFSQFFPGAGTEDEKGTSVHAGAKTMAKTESHVGGMGPGKVSAETKTVVSSSSVSSSSRTSYESTGQRKRDKRQHANRSR